METFGGVAVTPSKPTPPPQPIVRRCAGRAGGPGWIKWAAVGGRAATVALLVVVIVLMQRKPTVIVVPPAPTLGDNGGKKVADKPITVEDPGAPASGVAAAGAGGTVAADAKRAQKRPPSSARAGTTPKPPAENLSNTQRNLASLYRDDGNGRAASTSPARGSRRRATPRAAAGRSRSRRSWRW